MLRNLVTYCLLVFSLAAGCIASPPSAAPKPSPSSSPPLSTLSDKPLSQRVVAYQIDARFDPHKHTLDATEVLT